MYGAPRMPLKDNYSNWMLSKELLRNSYVSSSSLALPTPLERVSANVVSSYIYASVVCPFHGGTGELWNPRGSKCPTSVRASLLNTFSRSCIKAACVTARTRCYSIRDERSSVDCTNRRY